MRPERLLLRLERNEFANVKFADLTRLVEAVGFRRTGRRGSHEIYMHPKVRELINLQRAGGQAKTYQVRQVASLIRQYDLRLEDG